MGEGKMINIMFDADKCMQILHNVFWVPKLPPQNK